MKRTCNRKAVGVLVVTLMIGALGMSAEAAATGQKTLIGTVSDSMCGRTHMLKDKSEAECLRLCVKQGSKYALVVGKEVYTLVGHEADLDKYAAQKVRVAGSVKGTTITVASVAPVEGGSRKER